MTVCVYERERGLNCSSHKSISCFFLFFLATPYVGILVPWPGIKPVPSLVKALSPNHWTAREVLLIVNTAAAAKSLQSCLTLCDSIDSSPPGSPVPGILQARTLEWVAISFSNAWKWKVKVKSPSRVQLLATPWSAAYQAPLSMRFSRQEYWSGVPLLSPFLILGTIKFHLTLFLSITAEVQSWLFSASAPIFLRLEQNGSISVIQEIRKNFCSLFRDCLPESLALFHVGTC